MLVGTFIDKLSPLKPDTVQIVRDRLVQRLGDEAPRLCPVSCINNEGEYNSVIDIYLLAKKKKQRKNIIFKTVYY